MSSRSKEGTGNGVCGLAGCSLSSGLATVPVLALRSSAPARHSACSPGAVVFLLCHQCEMPLPMMGLGFGENQTDSTARLNLHPVCRLGGLGLDSTHRPPHCPVHHGKKASRYLEFLVLSGIAVPSGHSSLVLQTKAVSVPQNVQAACPSFGRVSPSGCFLWRQLLLSLRMGSVQLEKDTSPRLRECTTTTAPLTRLCRSLAGGETHQVFFFQDG